MPRRGPVTKRKIVSDPIYNDKLVAQLINNILRKGKKSIAEQIAYEAFDIIREKTGNEPVNVLKRAIDNVKPILEVKSRRVGGANYQVPVEVNSKRGVTLAFRWIAGFSRNRSEKRMCERLAAELLDASNGTGASIKKKEDLRKMAEANRAFAHYRW
ncbi:30S ribosomal protein S7 [Candidatus Oleimmundimicrobium sp.]|uniref:30S ribosomal protein S7 n=1 Tax=Candidatus Oleimmundimicrobium sp. TaxID=3060597 RepID=UPI002724224A|nr:30S ribosomal protein S7 [Candidatus Oleimmundimicrobium sp.]MDO8885946.1 30S ribosomal protein S7 [Candidatus Oleimmundimicrobium sp.]